MVSSYRILLNNQPHIMYHLENNLYYKHYTRLMLDLCMFYNKNDNTLRSVKYLVSQITQRVL